MSRPLNSNWNLLLQFCCISVNIAIRLQTGQLEIEILEWTRHYSFFLKHPDWLWGPHIFLLCGYQGCFSGIKWQGHDVDNSPPSGAKVKNEWGYTSISIVCLNGVDMDDIHCKSACLLYGQFLLWIYGQCAIKGLQFSDLTKLFCNCAWSATL
jgi:hypothetical protein